MAVDPEQFNFLQNHNISLSEVLDATGMPQKEWRQMMSEMGYLVAIGVTPCGKAGHTMRTSGGHCVQCDPKKLALILRYHEGGEIYLAFSDSTGIFKVGMSGDAGARVKNLNYSRYAEIDDWVLLHKQYFDNAGRIEPILRRELKEFRVYDRFYQRTEGLTESSEIYADNSGNFIYLFHQLLATHS